MTSASGQRTALRYVSETAFGVPTGTVFKALRFTDGVSLNLNKANYRSNEIRPDRQVQDLRHGMRSVAGDIPFELSVGTYDDLLAGAVAGNWSALTTGELSLSATTGTNVVGRSAGSFITDGFNVGDEITLAGFATSGNNGRTKVRAVTDLGLTVEKNLTTDAAADGRSVELVGRKIKAGTVLKTFTVERAFLDVEQFLQFSGCVVDSFSASIKPEEIITGSFSLLGKDMTQTVATAATSITPAPSNSPLDAFRGVILEGGQTIAYITGLELELSNGRSLSGAIGTATADEVAEGTCEVSGTLTAKFRDAVLLQKFITEAESSIDVRLDDVNGTDFLRFFLPRVKYTGGTLDNPREGLLTLSLPFTALYSPDAGTALIIQRSNA